jgi:hypothetical protein
MKDMNSNVVPTTVEAVMASHAFQAGFADARAKRGYGVDRYPIREQWQYERGWAFARRFPDVRQVAKDGRLTARAVELFRKATWRGDIL